MQKTKTIFLIVGTLMFLISNCGCVDFTNFNDIKVDSLTKIKEEVLIEGKEKYEVSGTELYYLIITDKHTYDVGIEEYNRIKEGEKYIFYSYALKNNDDIKKYFDYELKKKGLYYEPLIPCWVDNYGYIEIVRYFHLNGYEEVISDE